MSKFVIAKASDNIRYYWVLKANNNEVVATSQMYWSKAGAEHGINVVRAAAPSATVLDTTTAMRGVR